MTRSVSSPTGGRTCAGTSARATSPWLSQKFVDEWFQFRQVLTGTKVLQPRWKRCVRFADEMMGEALAQPFVKEYLGEDGKQAAAQMVAGIETSMKGDLESLAWMDDATRTKAEEKLGKIVNKIGYPAKWRSYDGLAIDRGSFLGERGARQRVRGEARAREGGQARRQGRVGDDAADGERVLRAHDERDGLPRGHPAAAVLRKAADARRSTSAPSAWSSATSSRTASTTRGGSSTPTGNLRDWWSPTVGAEFDRRAELRGEAVRRVRPGRRHAHQGQADPRREHRRPRRPQALVRGVPARREGASRPSAAHRRSARASRPSSSSSSASRRPGAPTTAPRRCGCWSRPTRTRRPSTASNGPLSNLPEFASAFQCKEGAADGACGREALRDLVTASAPGRVRAAVVNQGHVGLGSRHGNRASASVTGATGASAPRSPEHPRPDPEHEARAVEAIARALGDIPFYRKRGDAPPGARGSLSRGALARVAAPLQEGRPRHAAEAVGAGRAGRAGGARVGRARARRDERLDRRAPAHPVGQGLVDAPGGARHAHERRSSPRRWTARAAPTARRSSRRRRAASAPATSATCRTRSASTSHRLFLNQRPDPMFWTAPRSRRGCSTSSTTHATVGLESDPLYLAILARFAAGARARRSTSRGFVQLTYAFTTRAHLRAIRRGVRGPGAPALRRERGGRPLHGGRRRAPPPRAVHDARGAPARRACRRRARRTWRSWW